MITRIKDKGRRIYIINEYILTVRKNSIILDSVIGTGNIMRDHAAYLLRKWRRIK